MRMTLAVGLCLSLLNGCALLPPSQEDLAQRLKRADSLYAGLQAGLASDLQTRDLEKLEALVARLKETYPEDHPRQKDIDLAAQWIEETRMTIAELKKLYEQVNVLKAEVRRKSIALQEIRRTLIAP